MVLLGAMAWLLAMVGNAAPVIADPTLDNGHPDAAAGLVERRPAIASFEGQEIDLAQDWGEARACLVWRQGGVLECFRTPEALDARAAALSHSRGGPPSEPVTAASAYSCSSSLRLFQYNYYAGRQLSFWDRGYWQNLGDYGFDNQASSYIVGGCYAHLAENNDGGGWWYPGPTYPYAGEAVMSWSWQNAVSSIFIN